ncbi:type VI secretion system accessory protein TagJ [Ralstonia holmesii]|uniref:type VI secretion system accessory protein TagJ n=1 Tax=Ralstonia TaxID=48736 RepID=UPI00046AA58E|nr:type VI secretion system accessory protein TagJ [Ralstonia pickettii]
MTTDALLLDPPSTSGLAAVLQHSGSVAQALQNAEVRVRQQPGAFEERWQLFQWLCVTGDWERALKQLQVATQLTPDFAQTAHAYRNLIRAEIFRQGVFNGEREPGALLSPPAWMEPLHKALAQAASGNIEEADHSRNLALVDATTASGAHNAGTFAWISDSDTRLGPTCEIISAGRYAWLPFIQTRRLEMSAVTGLLDLVWRPVTVTLADGMVCRGFIPVRYPGSEHGNDTTRLARETHWTELGETGVLGWGQKTWATDQGDIGLLDVTLLVLEN